jgi:hypothetical protein
MDGSAIEPAAKDSAATPTISMFLIEVFILDSFIERQRATLKPAV